MSRRSLPNRCEGVRARRRPSSTSNRPYVFPPKKEEARRRPGDANVAVRLRRLCALEHTSPSPASGDHGTAGHAPLKPCLRLGHGIEHPGIEADGPQRLLRLSIHRCNWRRTGHQGKLEVRRDRLRARHGEQHLAQLAVPVWLIVARVQEGTVYLRAEAEIDEGPVGIAKLETVAATEFDAQVLRAFG